MNKKKICIVIIGVLILIILACILINIFTRKNISVSNNEKNPIQEENTIALNEIVENNLAVVDENIIKNDVPQDTNISKEEKIKTSNNKETSKETIQNNQKVKSNKEQNHKVQVPITSTEETQAKPQENINNNKEDKPTSVPSQKPVKPEENTEKYIRNDNIINKIKQVIKENETANMKDFGYNIVVDSSIKNQTNQFTYTTNRVINSIKSKFGTIRIYAEDYYKNGDLVMTMCYIL